MKTIIKISEDVKQFLQTNLFTESYRGINHEYEYNGKNLIDFNIQHESVIKKAERDLILIKDRVKNYHNRQSFKVGEFIHLPDGQKVIISHIWDDTVQTSGGGSMHLNSGGGISFSGGLDSGIKKTDLILTKEFDSGQIWIFHEGLSGGNRGVHYKMPFRVYKTKKSADLTGIPQVAELKRQKLISKSETITRTNGNGQPYTLHMPEITITVMHDDYKNKAVKGENLKLAGLNFKVCHWGNLKVQPMTKKQINTLLKVYDFTGTYYNNGTYQNELFLKATYPGDREIMRELK